MENKKDITNNKNYVQKLISHFSEDNQKRVALLLYDGMKITEIYYKRFSEDILRAAGFFAKTGIINKHIALIGSNCYEWIIAFFAITASGNVAVLMNPSLPREILIQQCKKADVFMACGEAGLVSELSADICGKTYGEIRGDKAISVDDIASLDWETTTILMFTSGTTEKSKIVEITYENMNSSICSADEVFDVPETDKIMTVLPMFHIAGLRGVLAMLYRYKTLCIGRGAMHLFKDMSIFSPSYLQIVPMIAESIVKIIKHTSEKEDRQKYLGTNLKRICIGGATVDPKICRYLMEEGFIIDSAYAMTETTGVGTWGQWHENCANTIGRLSGELLCRIEDGELLFKGAAIMKGYYKDPEATDLVLKDGWLYSGDLGFCDSDGYYYITGRKKKIIVMSNGEKINLEEIERYFKTCDAILECIVYYDGKSVCVEIYTEDDKKARAFIKEYNDKMPASYQAHKVMSYSTPLKKNGSGKIMWKREDYAEGEMQ